MAHFLKSLATLPSRFLAGLSLPALTMALLLAGYGMAAAAPSTAEEWYKQADQQYQDGSVNDAVASLEQALKLKKDYVEALVLLGSCHVESGEFAKAVDPYKRAAQLRPNDYSVLLAYSNALEGAGRTEDQLPVLKSLWNLNKTDLVTGIKYLTLIEAAGREKHVDDYIALLEDLRKTPNADPTYTVKLARAYNKTGNYPKAVATFEELVKTNPESGEYWSGLANAQAKFDPASARESYKKAILYTDRADEKAKLEKAAAALGNAPATPVAKAAAPAPEAAPAVPAAAPAAPVAAEPAVPAPSAVDAKAEAKAAAQTAAAKAKADAEAKAQAAAQAKAEAAAKAAAAEAEKKEAARLAKEEKDRQAKEEADRKAQAEADKKAAAAAKAQAKADSLAQAQADKKAQAAAKAAAADAEKLAREEAARLAKEEKDRKAQLAKDRADSAARAEADKKAALEADKKAREEALRLAKEEKDQKAKEEADRKAQELAEKKAQAKADSAAKAEAARLAKEEKERKAKERADSVAAVIAEKKAKAEADSLAKKEALRLAKEEKERRAKERADSAAAALAEKKAQAEAAKQAKAEALRLAKEEKERKLQARKDSIAAVVAERKAKAQADSLAKAEALRLAKEEKERLAKEAAERRAQELAEKKAQAQADSVAKAEAARLAREEKERIAKERADSIATAMAEKKAKAQADSLARVEAARLAKEEKERRAKAKADSLAQVAAEKKAREEAARLAREEAARLAKEEAERKAKARADSIAQVVAERKEKAKADSIAHAEAVRLAKEEAERKAKERADSIAQVVAERKAKAKADSIAHAEAVRLAKEEAERRAKERADSIAQVVAERKAKAKADSIAHAEAVRLAKEEADRRAKERADSLARAEEERKVRLEAERKAKEEAARLAREEAERKAKERADSLARVEADRRAKAEEERQFQQSVTSLLTGTPAKVDTAAVLTKIQEKRAAAKAADPRLIEAEAIIYFNQWNFRLVVDDLKKLKVLTPAENRLMALSLYELQDYPGALKHFQKVPNITSNRVEWGKYIKTLLENKMKPKAASEYEAYLGRYADADDALAFLVDYYRQPLNKEKLAPKLELMLAKNPKDAALLAELMNLYDKNSAKGMEYRQRYLQANPDDNKESLVLAQAYEAHGNLKDAIAIYQRLATAAPADKALNLKTAELLYQNHQVPDALKLFEQAHAADPADKKLTLRLAGLYEEAKMSDKAVETYTQALEADPKDKAVLSKLLQLYTAKGDQGQVRNLLVKLDENDPTAHAAQYQLAKLYLSDGDKEKAYFYLSKALKNQPNNLEYMALLPQTVTTEEQADAHFAALEKSALLPGAKPELQALVAHGYAKRKNNPMAARLYAEAYAKDPKLVEGKRDAVTALAEARNYELAGALAEKYLATDDKDKGIREIQVNAYQATNKPVAKLRDAIRGLIAVDPSAEKYLMRLAQLDLAAGDTVAAVDHAKQWADKNPKDANGWRFLQPLVKGRAGQEDAYVQVLEHLVQSDPAGRGKYDSELGALYFNKGNYEDAEKSYLAATKGSPANATLWYRLGQTEDKLRKEKDAAEKYKRAYQLAPANLEYARAYSKSVDSKDEIKANLALFKLLAQNGPSVEERKKLAQSLFLNGDYINSAKEWDAQLAADPNLAGTEPMIADAYMRSGQAAKARGLYEQRLQQDPNNLGTLETVAGIYKQEGNQKGYVSTVEKIVAVDPKYKGYQLVLATEKEKARDNRGALDAYAAWVDRNPADLTALKAMHRLAESEKDTTLLMSALTRLNREKTVDNQYKFQLAEIDFKKSGNLPGVERLVKTHPDWKRGKAILVREYIRTNAKQKLVPLEGFLVAEARTDKTLLEPLADLYAMQHMKAKANSAYYELAKANPKDKVLYAKARKFSAANDSPYMNDILRIGYEAYPDDMEIKRSYAATLGKTPKALSIYQEILASETDVKVLAKAVDIAVTLHQTQVASQLLDKWVSIDAKDPKVWEQALAIHTQLGNRPKMAEDLEQLVGFYPKNKDMALQLARLYEEQKQTDKAIDMYKKGLDLDPRNKAVQSKLVALLTASNQKDDLREVLLKIDRTDATAHEAQFKLAQIFLESGDRDRAYTFLAKALKNQPANPEYTALLPKVVVTDEQVMQNFPALEKQALQPGAAPELQALVARGYAKKNNFLMASRLFSEVYAKSPRLLDGNRGAVTALYEAKNYELAGALADKYISAGNDKDKGVQEIRFNSYTAVRKPAEKMRDALKGLIAVDSLSAGKYMLKLAELDLAARDTTYAVVHAKLWVEKNPKSAEGWRMLYPLVKNKAGEEETYIHVLEKLVALDPANRARYDLELGDLYFNKGNYEDAEKSMLSATKGSPANAALWYKLGDVETKLRRPKDADGKYQRAYQLAPTNIEYARAYSKSVDSKDEIKANLPLFKFLAQNGPSVEERKKLAQAYFLNGDYANSAKEWEWLLKGDPTIASVEPMVADAYMRSGQSAKARGLYEQRLQQDPNNLAILETVGGIYKQEGNQAGYVSTVEKIVAVDPKYKGYQLVLAMEKEKAKDYKAALDNYDQWVQRNPTDIAALKSMHRLSEQQKDTTNLMEALVRLNRMKNPELVYSFQLAELDFVRSGNINGIEALVKKHPEYRRGKAILVKQYYRKGALAKMVPYLPFLSQEAKTDKDLAEPLADLYAFQKKPALANEAYFDAYRAYPKDRDLFDKVYKYAKEHDSPYRAGLLKQGYEAFPDDVGLKFDYAMTLGKTPKALDLFSDILIRDRNNLPALRNAAEIAVILHKQDQAVGFLQRWVALEPDQPKPWSMLVDYYTQTKNDAKLADALEKLSSLSPKDGELAFKAAVAYRKIGNKEKALELFTKAVALNGTNPSYQREFGLTLFQSGQIARAKAPLLVADRSMKNDEEINSALYNIYMADKNKGMARERMRTLFAIKPFKKDYAFGLARLEYEMKQPEEAVKILEKPSLRDSLDAEMSFILLNGYFRTGQKDKALVLGPQLLRKYPEEAKENLALGILFYETKNRDKAQEILEGYVRKNPEEEAFYYLGKVYYEKKSWQNAINNLERAQQSRPDVLSMLAQSYIANHEPDRAIRAYEDYYAKTKDTKILVELYGLYKKTNDAKGTQNILERLIAADPQNYDYRVELAEMYRSQGDVKKAEAQYELILKKMPAHPASNMNLGMILAARKDYARATRMLEIGLAKYPDSALAWRYLGDAYRNEKRYASALQAYKKTFKLQPTNLSVAIAKMQLSKELNANDELPSAYADVIKLDSNNIDAAKALAEISYANRKYADAAALYGKVTGSDPGNRDAWANYGYSLLEVRRIDEAKRALQRAVDLGMKDGKLMTSLARIYKEEGNADKAEQLLSEIVKKDPRNHLAYFWLGQIAADRNQPGVAEDYFKKAQLLAPANADYVEALARSNYNKDEFGTAARLLEPVRANLSTTGRLMYGDCLMKMGKTEQALAEFNAVYAKDPSAPVLAKLAELQTYKGNGREAARIIENSQYKDDSTVQFALAKARIASHEQDKARDILDRLIRSNKYNAGYYHYRGLSWYEDKNYSKAQKDFDMALKYNPDYMDAVYHTGLCLMKDGRSTDAKNYFKELSQHSNPTWQAKGFLGLAMTFESEKKMEAAENFLQKSLAAEESADALSLLAKVLLKMRKPAEAEKSARRALELRPDNATAVVAMSDVLLAQGRKAEALQLSKRALQDNPNSCELLIGSAKVNFAAGNLETSKSNSTYAISICPEEPQPYYFVGVIADKKYDKKAAKDMFKAYRKHGGDEEMLPADYR